MKIRMILIVAMIVATSMVYGQKFTVSGLVEDSQTGRGLKDVTVSAGDGLRVSTNGSGFFSLELGIHDIPTRLGFTLPEYLKKTYKVERSRFNKNRELWLEIKMHPSDSSKVRLSEAEIGNPVVSLPEVNVMDFHIVGNLLYTLVESREGFDYLQVYNLEDSLLAQVEVEYKYENFYHNSLFECYIADENYGCMRRVFYKDGRVWLGPEKCVAGFVYWAFGDARVGDLILQQQDIYIPPTLRVFYLTPELTLDFAYWQLRYVASLNSFVVRGDTADYNSIKRRCLSGDFADDMQAFISSRIAADPSMKDSMEGLKQYYIDTMYEDWFRTRTNTIINTALDEAYKIKDDMRQFGYRYMPYCRPTFVEVGEHYYVFNLTSMALTKFDRNMNFISTIALNDEWFSYFYLRDHAIVSSYAEAYAISSRDDLGVVSAINLDSGSIDRQQTLLRTVTDEHRVEIRNGYIYYMSYYAYLEKNLYKEPLKMVPIKGRE